MALTVLVSGSGFTSINNLESQMTAAEAGVPEYSLMELQMNIKKVYVPFEGMVSPAQYFATQINNYLKSHNVKVDNETVKPWPGSSVIAFGDDTASTLIVKWQKGQVFVGAILTILRAIAPYVIAGVAAYYLISLVEKWIFGTPVGSPLNPKNIPTDLGLIALLVIGPLVVREAGSIIGSERRYVRQVRGR